jgi:hypothetical protein
MREEDPGKLSELFEKYRIEYMQDRGNNDDVRKRQKAQDPPVMQERATGSSQPAAYEDMEVGAIDKQEANIMKVKVVFDDNGECLKTLQGMIDPEMKLRSGDPDECLKALDDHFDDEFALDDVNNIPLPLDEVRKARKEEMSHMKHKIFKVVKKGEAWRVTGKAPISTKWVDTDKTHGTCSTPTVRSRWVARDFKNPNDKDREDLFSATPPIEMMRLMISRQATRRQDGRERKTMYLDIKKAHLTPKCEQDVYVELPEEAEVAEDECGKRVHWLYGCCPAAQSWEEHYGTLRVQEAEECAGGIRAPPSGHDGGSPRRRLRVGRARRRPRLHPEGAGGELRVEKQVRVGRDGLEADRHVGQDHQVGGRRYNLAGRPTTPTISRSILSLWPHEGKKA